MFYFNSIDNKIIMFWNSEKKLYFNDTDDTPIIIQLKAIIK